MTMGDRRLYRRIGNLQVFYAAVILLEILVAVTVTYAVSLSMAFVAVYAIALGTIGITWVWIECYKRGW